MSLKYCFHNEIHKTFDLPIDFHSLLQEIISLFVCTLPPRFLLQYKDADGDTIFISNNQDYQTLLKHELPKTSSIKIFVTALEASDVSQIIDVTTPRRMSDDGSFEVVDDQENPKVEEIVDYESTEEKSPESKIVVSLKIPQLNLSKPQNKMSDISESSRGGSVEPKKSKRSRSVERVHEITLSMEGERSLDEGESSVSQTVFNKAFQTEGENLSLSEEFPRSHSKRSLEAPENGRELRKMATLEVPEYKEKDSRDLSEYLSRMLRRKSQDPSQERLPQILCCDASDVEDERFIEESQERWVSFSTEQNDIPAGQNIELQGKNLFALRQRSDAWRLRNSIRGYRASERRMNHSDSPSSPISSDNKSRDVTIRMNISKQKIRSHSNSLLSANCSMIKSRKDTPRRPKRYNKHFRLNSREMEKVMAFMRSDELEQSYDQYQEMESDRSDMFSDTQRKVEIRDRDIWADLAKLKPLTETNFPPRNTEQYNSAIKLKVPELTLPRRRLSIDSKSGKNNEENTEENVLENVETMNISLLTASEANYMASAIGSIHKIAGFRKLEVNRECSTPEKRKYPQKQLSPIQTKWECKDKEMKIHEEEGWPFLKQSGLWKRREPIFSDEKLPHEGSFCMKCWESPICGARYLCLVCEDIEYCERCESQTSHCHPLLKIKEPRSSVQELLDHLHSKFLQKEDILWTQREKHPTPIENSHYKEMDTLTKSIGRSMDLGTYMDMIQPGEFCFEYKEVSSTPLMIRSQRKEWCVVYKTLILKNTGSSTWIKCHLEPIGLVPGTITEVSYVGAGDSRLVTLEIHGFFEPGKYNSTWRVTHQGEIGILYEMGYIDLEFEVMENGQLLYEEEFREMMDDFKS
jgi:hypothetical protein